MYIYEQHHAVAVTAPGGQLIAFRGVTDIYTNIYVYVISYREECYMTEPEGVAQGRGHINVI